MLAESIGRVHLGGMTERLTLLLTLSGVLLAASLTAGELHPIDLIDDQERIRQFENRFGTMKDAGQVVAAEVLVEQLQERSKPQSTLPVNLSTETRSLTPAEIYRLRRDSVVMMGRLYKCDHCDDWHISVSGGVMLSEDGIGVTNYHVIMADNADAFGIMTFDGVVYPVEEILAGSRVDDLAFFRVDGDGFRPAPLSRGDDPGTPVTAITHPRQQLYYVSHGIVARNYIERRGRLHRPRLAITADYARGSSGAGIFNDRGDLASIVSSTRSIYYTREDGIDRNLQMVMKITVPAHSILELAGWEEEPLLYTSD
ncbi:MAG: serine protease [Puniceicoccaceae bacterium]|nr:MAG: serine protease [Puniceicoccaceae bacterium]